MHLSGSLVVDLPIEHVWAYLYDVNHAAACAPGFKAMVETAEHHWTAEVEARLLLFHSTFSMDITRPTADAPEHMVISAVGAAPGSDVGVVADLHLAAVGPESTGLLWAADVAISGKMASVGAKLIQGLIEKQTAAFFKCLKETMERKSW